MLAKTYLTAKELGLTEIERDALIQVLEAIDSGKIAVVSNFARLIGHEQFLHMGNWRIIIEDENCCPCATVACIAGWGFELSGGKAFQFVGSFGHGGGMYMKQHPDLRDLFLPSEEIMKLAGRVEVRHALFSYLSTGKADWG